MEGTQAKTNTMNPGTHQTTTTQSKVISHAFLTGTAKHGSIGPGLGHVDIGESENAFFFRVSIPGIEKYGNRIRCEIEREGRVCIRGVIPEMTISRDTGCLYRLQVQQCSPPGPFSLSFNLPGQVDPRLFYPDCKPGVLEVVVIKLGVRVHASQLHSCSPLH